MSETTTTETTVATGPSRKRVITANVTASAVSILLTIGAGLVIDRVAGKVKTAIAPDTTEN
jgi:hypothetical protein